MRWWSGFGGAVAVVLAGAAGAAPAPAAIGSARCAANRAAGRITFLTSSAYAASVGILDVIAADRLGYFAALCLDVSLQAGSANAQLVSAGTAQIAGLGGAADVMVAADHGAHIVGIATYGNTSASELLTMQDGPVHSLPDLQGRIVGYKLALPPQVSAMLIGQGVDMAKVDFVSVGYDPVILPRGNVAGLTVYKSNEPAVLRAQGARVREWDPERYGIHATFNTQIANAGWAHAHPSAVQDFLRASLHAYDWIGQSDANLTQALTDAAALSPAGYDVAASRRRWLAEAALVRSSQPPGTPTGWQAPVQWAPEAAMLVRFGLVSHPPDLAAEQDSADIAAIHDGARLIWPAP